MKQVKSQVTGRISWVFTEDLDSTTTFYAQLLACISRHLSTAAMLCRALLDFHSVRTLNIVSLCLRRLATKGGEKYRLGFECVRDERSAWIYAIGVDSFIGVCQVLTEEWLNRKGA